MSDSQKGYGLVAPDELQRIDQYRRDKNTSVLVVMFTDITGSTEFAEKHGEEAYNALRLRHNKILLGIIERDDAGRFVKNIGDAIMAVFAKPSDAVERALEIQRTLREHNAVAADGETIVIRIGMHMGQVAKDDTTSTDVFGRHVNRAARVESLTPPGHILITRPIYDSAKGWIDNKRYAFVEHGEYKLKGIAEPADLVEPYEPGVVKPASPRIASWKERIKRWPVVPLLVIFGCAFFLLLLTTYITPIIYYMLNANGATVDDFGVNGAWSPIGPAMHLAAFLDEYGPWLLLLLIAALLIDRFVSKGIHAVRRRHRVLTVISLVLALTTGVIYFAETAAIAIMVPAITPSHPPAR